MNTLISYMNKFIKYLVEYGFMKALHKVYRVMIMRIKMRQYVKASLPTKETLDIQRKTCFVNAPLISIITPLYNTPIRYLRNMIDSVCEQSYENWQLCLADGSDVINHAEEVVRQYSTRYPGKIKYIRLKENKGISENTNECIRLADGEYLAILDHDDILAPNALYEVVNIVNEKDADVVYTDEMVFRKRITNIVMVHLKPDFAIDNLRGNNYVCHLLVFRKSLLDRVGMFRKECDGSQDHDMILRLSEVAEQIVHIPKVLYYWRAHSNSVAGDINSKKYVAEAGIKAVSDHLSRIGIKAKVESSEWFPVIYRIKYELVEEPLISIIIINNNGLAELKYCIDSVIVKSTYSKYEIIIMDIDASNEDTVSYYEETKKCNNVRIVYWQHEYSCSAIYNCGVSYSKGKHIVFLHSDTKVISPDWIQEMLMNSQRSDVGAVGAKLYYSNNTIQHAGIIIKPDSDMPDKYVSRGLSIHDSGCMGNLFYSRRISAVTIACMMVKKALFEKIGGLDEKFSSDYNGLDFCLRLCKAGYANIFTPYSKLYHYDKMLFNYVSTNEISGDIQLLNERWGYTPEINNQHYRFDVFAE